jgi:hypothetical protein
MSNIWERNERAYAKVLARYWTDEKFKQSLLANPRGVLTQAGFQLPPSANVQVAPNATKLEISATASPTLTLPLPQRPPSITDATLRELTSSTAADDHSVGVCCCCCCV